MKKITLILPSSTDPLVTHLWLLNFESYKHLFSDYIIYFDFMGEYDEVEVDTIMKYYHKLSKEKNFILSHNPRYGQHGNVLHNIITDNYDKIQDYVFFSEEDDLILNPNLLSQAIDYYFNNNISVFGAPRGSCTYELFNAEEDFMSNQARISVIRNNNRKEFNFWPCLFLIGKQNLNKHLVDPDIFCSNNWEKNTQLQLGDKKYTFAEQQCGDTFVKFSVNLFNDPDIKSILYLTNIYHSMIEDYLYCLPDYINERNTNYALDDSIDFHIGSLSCMMRFKMWKSVIINEPNMRVRIEEFAKYINENLHDEESKYQTSIEYYRRFYILYEFFKRYVNPNTFEFYKNYNDSFNLIFNWFKYDYNFVDLFSTHDSIYTKQNVIKEVYTNVSSKLFKYYD